MKTLFNWIGRALSEKGNPSSKRLFGFLFVLVACFGVVYTILKQHNFVQYLFYGVLIMVALLAGVATMPQIIELWRGNSNKPTEPPKE